MLTGAATRAPAVIFMLDGRLSWPAALPLSVGMFAGARLGPAITRRVPRAAMRWCIVALGLTLAIELFA
jgi:uncharacterized protein